VRPQTAAPSFHTNLFFDRLKLVKRLTISCSALLLGLLVQGLSMAQTAARQKIDLSKLGPQVGERVPDFSLKDQNGKTWTLQSLMGPKGAMLVFIRSADW
jgi:cytochrome oxidase Cu insertion factor (SCO1/SenC/PrrC family)